MIHTQKEQEKVKVAVIAVRVVDVVVVALAVGFAEFLNKSVRSWSSRTSCRMTNRFFDSEKTVCLSAWVCLSMVWLREKCY